MNFTKFFEKDAAIRDVQASVVDHGWMMDGIIHPGEPQLDISGVKNPNNVKPELEMQWGGGMDVSLNEPAGVVERNLPEGAEGDAGSVIMFARDMMNRGFGSAKVASALRSKYGKDALAGARKGLTELFAMDGIIGRVAVDGRGYRSCKEALKAASRSPYKGFIRWVVGCECGDPHVMPPAGSGSFVEQESSGNPMDDFLASKKEAKTAMVAHCRSTMLPTVATVGDLDPSDMDQTFVELMNVTGMPSGVKDELMAMKSSTARVAAAFRWLDRVAAKTTEAKYDGAVKADRLVRAQADIELDGIWAQPDLEVAEGAAPLEILPEFDGADMPDVDMGQSLDPEFEGSDEVMIDDAITAPTDLGVETAPRLDDEDLFLAEGGK